MKINSTVKDEAQAKLVRLQKCSKYHSFFNVVAIDAFAMVEGSAIGGKSCGGSVQEIPVP